MKKVTDIARYRQHRAQREARAARRAYLEDLRSADYWESEASARDGEVRACFADALRCVVAHDRAARAHRSAQAAALVDRILQDLRAANRAAEQCWKATKTADLLDPDA